MFSKRKPKRVVLHAEELPQWGLVALASRAVKRVEPLMKICWPAIPQKHLDTVQYAIQLAENASTQPRTAETLGLAGLRLSFVHEPWIKNGPAGQVGYAAGYLLSAADAASDDRYGVSAVRTGYDGTLEAVEAAIRSALEPTGDQPPWRGDLHHEQQSIDTAIVHTLRNIISTSTQKQCANQCIEALRLVVARDRETILDQAPPDGWAHEDGMSPEMMSSELWPAGLPGGWPSQA